MPFRHDSTGIDPDSSIMLLPPGWYVLKIFEAEERQSKKGNDMILVKCKVVNKPEYKEAELWHYVVFLPKDVPGAGISVMFRKAIGVPHGGDDIVDAEDWVGKKFQGHVIQDTYDGKTRNKIESIKGLEEVLVSANGKGSVDDDDGVPF